MSTTKQRPEVLNGATYKIKTSCGSFYLTLNHDDGELNEVVLRLGKAGSCVRNLLEHIGILYSILLQSGLEKDRLIKIMQKHTKDINCGNPFEHKEAKYKSCLDYMAGRILEELQDGKTK